jgi:hypothetical protein
MQVAAVVSAPAAFADICMAVVLPAAYYVDVQEGLVVGAVLCWLLVH